MIRGILFDMGGTLDGEGHWLDRFAELYLRCGTGLPRETIRGAFDAAEARAATDEAIVTAGIDRMVGQHVTWQFEHLGLDDQALHDRLVSGFVESVRTAAAVSRRVLGELTTRGFAIGVVSNACGNVLQLCRDYGFAPYLTAIVDSRRVGLSKPDPRIFARGAQLLDVELAHTLVVGDSFERDIVPAHSLGMKTAWLQPDPSILPPDVSAVDIRLERLDDLLMSLPVPAAS